jgi:hypothetical protein
MSAGEIVFNISLILASFGVADRIFAKRLTGSWTGTIGDVNQGGSQ